MTIKTIKEEDFDNYKKPSMVIGFSKCNFKCDIECGKQVCQNSVLAKAPNKEIDKRDIVKLYISNNLTSAIVFGGLEPFDTYEDMITLIQEFRKVTNEDIVIFTGYKKDEIEDKIKELKRFKNIIIKYGRFVPDYEKHFDDVLGVNLASNNQYAEVIS